MINSPAIPLLPRYFLRLFGPVFFLCLTIFTGVLLMNYFIKLFNMALMKGISFFWIIGCFARLLPYFISLAAPMAFLVAVLVTLGQLSEQGEVMALRASGFSFMGMTWPFLALAAVFSGALLFVNHKIAPEGFHAFRKQYSFAANQLSQVDVQPGTFMRLGSWNLYAQRAEPETGRLEGVYLVRQESKKSGIRVSAPTGLLILEKGVALTLELQEGALQFPNTEPQKLTTGRFSRYRLRVPVAGAPQAEILDIPEITSRGLKARIADPQTTPEHRNEYAVEVALRSAAALAPFIFFWIAAPLGMTLTRHSRGMGFAASLLILMAYYGLLALGIGVGRRHASLAALAPWAANIAGLILGSVLTRRAVLK